MIEKKSISDLSVIRLDFNSERISQQLLNKEEILRKERIREKEKEKELEKEKKKLEILSQEKLEIFASCFGSQSKKQICQIGTEIVKNFKQTHFEEYFGDDWTMCYFGNIKNFNNIFDNQAESIYLQCLLENKNQEILNNHYFKASSKIKKNSSASKKKESSQESSLMNYFKLSQDNGQSQLLTTDNKINLTPKKKKIKKKDPENLKKLDECILILGTGALKKDFDTKIILKIKEKFNYFSERKILMRVKELLRYGYIVKQSKLMNYLSDHDNKYKQSNIENINKSGIMGMLSKLNPESQNNFRVNKKIISDYFYDKKINEQLSKKFIDEIPK